MAGGEDLPGAVHDENDGSGGHFLGISSNVRRDHAEQHDIGTWTTQQEPAGRRAYPFGRLWCRGQDDAASKSRQGNSKHDDGAIILHGQGQNTSEDDCHDFDSARGHSKQGRGESCETEILDDQGQE